MLGREQRASPRRSHVPRASPDGAPRYGSREANGHRDRDHRPSSAIDEPSEKEAVQTLGVEDSGSEPGMLGRE
eukprot:1579431-Rhodomonas_salina.1